jgi:predicted transcriptional regulator
MQRDSLMVTKKEIMHRVVEQLPDEADWDEAIDRLMYIKGIERGLADVEAGRTISHEELLKRIESWRK